MRLLDFSKIILFLFFVIAIAIGISFYSISYQLKEELICKNDVCKIKYKYLPKVAEYVSILDHFDVSFDRKSVYLGKIENEYYLGVDKCIYYNFDYDTPQHSDMYNHKISIFYSPYLSKKNAEKDLHKIKSDKDLIITKYDTMNILEYISRVFLYLLALQFVLKKIKEEYDELNEEINELDLK